MQSIELNLRLQQICGDGLFRNCSLANLSNWKVGGVVEFLVKPKNSTQLRNVINCCNQLGKRFLVVGSTSNLLFSDTGLDAVLIQLGGDFSEISVTETDVIAQPGVWVPFFARVMQTKGLGGIEHIVGIPGTLGGLVCMNGGSLRRGIGENVTNVSAMNTQGEVFSYSFEECNFKYRESIFQTNNQFITEIKIRLVAKDKAIIRKEMLEIMGSRRRKFPRKEPNCGSVFVSDPAMYDEFGPPGKVIEQCGIKGKRFGKAEISASHANFIVNKGGATAEDILFLVFDAHSKVLALTGYDMRSEVLFVNDNGDICSVSEEAYRRFSN